MRNPNGYGAVINLGKNRRRPFAVRITAGWSDDGKAIYKYLGYYEKRADAMKALAEYNVNPHDLDGANMTFAEVYELATKNEFGSCSEQKKYSWNNAFRNCEKLHNVKISQIKTSDLQNIVDNSKSRSKAYLTNILVVMHATFKFAMQNDYVKKDYSAFVTISNASEQKIKSEFTDNEIEKLWSDKDNFYSKLTLILIYTGFRINELLTLKSENVHIEEKYLQGGLKTKSGKNRIVPIHNRILPLVKDFYEKSNTYLITYDDGNQVLYHQSFRNALQKRFDELGINRHTPHECRHTTASLLTRYNAKDVYIKKILGHSAKDITKDVYTHANLKDLLDTINLIP